MHIIFTMIYPFHRKEWKLKNSKSLQQTCIIKLNSDAHKKLKTNIKR